MHPDEIPSWKPFLRRIPLFKDLSAEDLHKVAGLLKPLSLPRGATLFHQGDAADAFYVITSGQVQLVSERQGRGTVTGYLGRGDTLGEIALLTGEPRSMTARLETTTEFLVLAKKDFAAVLRKNPEILLQLSRSLSARLTQETRAREETPLQPRVLALLSALGEGDRRLFCAHLALSLHEQTRRRVLLVDLSPREGHLARAFGLTPQVVAEEDLRERDLRDPALLARLVQVHPSGVGILSLPPKILSGRLYKSIFLLMNLLREHSDFCLLALDGVLEDVQRSILLEADQWTLAGQAGALDEFRRLRGELDRFVPEPKKLFSVWLGDGEPFDLSRASGGQWARLPWTSALAEAFRAGGAPFELVARHPKIRFGVESLARRFARLRVGLALGTGAALGLSLIGILKAFRRADIPVDLVAGTSIGSLIGGFYALGLEPEEIEKIALGIDKAWVWENLFWDMALPRAGFFSGTTLLRFIRSYFGEREFRELEKPFACVATDIESGEEVVFREGRVAEAIRASCGIPLIYQPFLYRGRFLVDGGLVDPIPVQVASQMGADVLIAVNLTMPAGLRRKIPRRRGDKPPAPTNLESLKALAIPQAFTAPNLAQVFFQMIYTMEYEIAKTREPLAHVYIHPDLSGFSWTELHRGKELIEAGEKVAEAVLPKIQALLPYFQNSCRVDFRSKPW